MSSQRRITAEMLAAEIAFTTSRSGGPGGQNVNKVNSKVTLHFNVAQSQILTEDERSVIAKKLASKINRDGFLTISSQESRSQLDNREIVIRKFEMMIAKAFERKKTRKATRPGKSAVQKRINKKKVVSEKKKWRRRPDL